MSVKGWEIMLNERKTFKWLNIDNGILEPFEMALKKEILLMEGKIQSNKNDHKIEIHQWQDKKKISLQIVLKCFVTPNNGQWMMSKTLRANK